MAHPLDVFDDLLEAYKSAEETVIGEFETESFDRAYADLNAELKSRRDDMETALAWYEKEVCK